MLRGRAPRRIGAVAIPAFRADGLLPEGIHEATWAEFSERFGWSDERRNMVSGIRAAMLLLADGGCRRLYVDGSFVTEKDRPNDWDGCWDPERMDFSRLNSLITDTSPGGVYTQKEWLLGELYPSVMLANPNTEILELFQRSRDYGPRKGIVVLDPMEVLR